MLTQVTRKLMRSKPEHSIYEDGGEWWRGMLLGEGSYGAVHLAHFPTTEYSARFKNFPPTVAAKSTSITRSEELKTEKAVYDALGESPFILHCFGDDITISTANGLVLNVFLEYASGRSLYDAIVARPEGFGLVESQARPLTLSILRGIKHIHEAGFTHSDIKPDNVLLVEERDGSFVPKIADFGAAKRAEDVTISGGTKMFMSPEIWEQGIQGQASDIWGLGCTVFMMMTGILEWNGEPVIREMSDPRRRISEEAEDFVRKCLSRDPRERPTAAELMSHPFVCESEFRGYDEPELFDFQLEQHCWCM